MPRRKNKKKKVDPSTPAESPQVSSSADIPPSSSNSLSSRQTNGPQSFSGRRSSISSSDSSNYSRQSRRNSQSSSGSTVSIQSINSQSSLYKTELCKSYQELGYCNYGAKCQFAHGEEELRPVVRHPKYKTEVCKNFQKTGSCPYGSRCRFIHPAFSNRSSSRTSSSSNTILNPNFFSSSSNSIDDSSTESLKTIPSSMENISAQDTPLDLLNFGASKSNPTTTSSSSNNNLDPISAPSQLSSFPGIDPYSSSSHSNQVSFFLKQSPRSTTTLDSSSSYGSTSSFTSPYSAREEVSHNPVVQFPVSPGSSSHLSSQPSQDTSSLTELLKSQTSPSETSSNNSRLHIFEIMSTGKSIPISNPASRSGSPSNHLVNANPSDSLGKSVPHSQSPIITQNNPLIPHSTPVNKHVPPKQSIFPFSPFSNESNAFQAPQPISDKLPTQFISNVPSLNSLSSMDGLFNDFSEFSVHPHSIQAPQSDVSSSQSSSQSSQLSQISQLTSHQQPIQTQPLNQHHPQHQPLPDTSQKVDFTSSTMIQNVNQPPTTLNPESVPFHSDNNLHSLWSSYPQDNLNF